MNYHLDFLVKVMLVTIIIVMPLSLYSQEMLIENVQLFYPVSLKDDEPLFIVVARPVVCATRNQKRREFNMLALDQMTSEEVLVAAIHNLTIEIETKAAARTVLQKKLNGVRILSQEVTSQEYARMRQLPETSVNHTTQSLALRESAASIIVS